MKTIIALLLVSNIAIGQRLALYTSRQFGHDLINEIKVAVYHTYKLEIDSIGEFKLPNSKITVSIPNLKEFSECYGDEVLDTLEKLDRGNHIGTIALTDCGILANMYNFFPEDVHGYSDHTVSIVTDHIINTEEKVEDHDFLMTNITVHEVGHLCGLDDCKHKRCVMVESGHLSNRHLCRRCKRKLKRCRH